MAAHGGGAGASPGPGRRPGPGARRGHRGGLHPAEPGRAGALGGHGQRRLSDPAARAPGHGPAAGLRAGLAALRGDHPGHHGHGPEPAAGGSHRPPGGAHRGPGRRPRDAGGSPRRHRDGRPDPRPAGRAHDLRGEAGHVPAAVPAAARGPGRRQSRVLPGQPARRGRHVCRLRTARRRGARGDGLAPGPRRPGWPLARHARRPGCLRSGLCPCLGALRTPGARGHRPLAHGDPGDERVARVTTGAPRPPCPRRPTPSTPRSSWAWP